MNLELDGRVAVVTGASAGIGRGIAKALAAEGVRLALIARRSDLLETLAKEIRANGALPPMLLVRDVTAADTPDEAKARVLETSAGSTSSSTTPAALDRLTSTPTIATGQRASR